jgi:hypothetical protein
VSDPIAFAEYVARRTGEPRIVELGEVIRFPAGGPDPAARRDWHATGIVMFQLDTGLGKPDTRWVRFEVNIDTLLGSMDTEVRCATQAPQLHHLAFDPDETEEERIQREAVIAYWLFWLTTVYGVSA